MVLLVWPQTHYSLKFADVEPRSLEQTRPRGCRGAATRDQIKSRRRFLGKFSRFHNNVQPNLYYRKIPARDNTTRMLKRGTSRWFRSCIYTDSLQFAADCCILSLPERHVNINTNLCEALGLCVSSPELPDLDIKHGAQLEKQRRRVCSEEVHSGAFTT